MTKAVTRIRGCLVGLVLVGMAAAGSGLAAEPFGPPPGPELTGPQRKLSRGVANLFTGWMEIPKQVMVGAEREGLLGGVVGLGKGMGLGVVRTVIGAYELLTFPAEVPENFRPPLTPEYVWQPEPAEE